MALLREAGVCLDEAVLLLSGMTDLLDGYIARRFNAVSDLGKVLDPVADKLNQGVMLLCLLTRFPLMWLPLGLMVVRELFMAVTGLWIIRKKRRVLGADWHGKAAAVLLYAVIILHMFWYAIPGVISTLAGSSKGGRQRAYWD